MKPIRYDNEQGIDTILREGVQRVRKESQYTALQRFIRDGAVVFDVGANIGWWTLAIHEARPDLCLHLFEPAPLSFATLVKTARRYFPHAKLNNLALGNSAARLKFFYYKHAPTLSGFFRRRGEEARGALDVPDILQVECSTLDKYCEDNNIHHIDVLKIDVEGSEFAVLKGAGKLLTSGAVDLLQFEYGGTFADSGSTLRSVYDFLNYRGYMLYFCDDSGQIPIHHWNDALENYNFANFLAIHNRLTGWFERRPPAMLDLTASLAREAITPRGVIHIGAHEGRELAVYRKMGAKPILFVEANPVVAEKLRQRMAGEPDVIVAEYAITDGTTETVELHVTSMDQSSSILPLKDHQQIYPTILEDHVAQVPAITVDGLLAKLGLHPSAFNFINIDIQGAELIALRGATNTLKHIEAINSEINFRELYEECALSHELDTFLYGFDFLQVDSVCPYDPSWGDAFYVKKSVISMSTLGRNGRFANCIFQYAFIKYYANKHGLKVELPPWIGNVLFKTNDPSPKRAYPRISQSSNDYTEDVIAASDPPLKNIDMWGYFQYPKLYSSERDKAYFRRLFSPAPQIRAPLLKAFSQIMSGKQTLVVAHLRRGDYGYNHFFVAPTQWYLDWLEQIWQDIPSPVLYIASDEPDKVLADFSAYHPISRADLGDLGLVDVACPYYADFFIMSKSNRLAISNSSFSFAAAMLNQTATQFMRPRLGLKKLIPFDPFDSPSLFRDECVD